MFCNVFQHECSLILPPNWLLKLGSSIVRLSDLECLQWCITEREAFNNHKGSISDKCSHTYITSTDSKTPIPRGYNKKMCSWHFFPPTLTKTKHQPKDTSLDSTSSLAIASFPYSPLEWDCLKCYLYL